MTSVKATSLENRGISLRSLSKWLSDLVDGILNWLFALTHNAALARNLIIWGVFYVILIYLVAGTRSFDEWSELFGNAFSVMLFPTLPLPNGDDAVQTMLKLLGALFGNLEVWSRLLALYAPFWLMHRITSIYLADIFAKEHDVARHFVIQAAFGTDYKTIHIREGKIVEEDQNSPIVQIGGPGYVMVELDSAALFERPDGTTHVISPTIGEWHGKKVIDGFERIRQAADLRDILGSQEISARSRDGIPVIAKDIQYSYSVYRGENPVKTLQTPYPFIESAIESLAYKTPRVVKPGVPPSGKPDWLAPLPGKIIGPVQLALGSFISGHGLSEFLSSIGAPEEDALRNREDELDKLGQQLSGRNGNNAGEIWFKPAAFTSRALITALFYEEGGFKKRAMDRGFEVNWIGVGTWVTPTEIIPANHLEAWKLSRENFLRSHPEELKRLDEEARIEEGLRLIQTTPINKFYIELQQADDADLVDSLIGDFYERMQSALELYERDGESPPAILIEALRVLNDVRGTSYRMINE